MTDFKDDDGDPERLYEAALREHEHALQRLIDRMRAAACPMST